MSNAVQIEAVVSRNAADDPATDRRVVRLEGGPNAVNPNKGFCTNTVVTQKYTCINFIPKFLFESFMQVANFYFLCVGALQCWPEISNTGGLPLTWATLFGILIFGSVIAALEDLRRRAADKVANGRVAHVFDRTANEFVQRSTAELRVGDLLLVKNREVIPADCAILLASSHGVSPNAYVETKSLDGETNLKLREELELTAAVLCASESSRHRNDDAAEGTDAGSLEGDHGAGRRAAAQRALGNLSLTVTCEQPNDVIDKFEGVIEIHGGASAPLPFKSILLRGCTLRNTEFVYALVLNTGADTKIMQSNKEPPHKLSSLHGQINRVITHVAFALFAVCALSAATQLLFADSSRVTGAWYLRGTGGQPGAGLFFQSFFYYFLLMYQFIPISLYVSMSGVNLIQSQLVSSDLEMYHAETDTPAAVRTMDLQSELGQISFVFSDKTGTLTQNVMEFRKCSIGGVQYGSGTTEIGRAAARRAAAASGSLSMLGPVEDDLTADFACELAEASIESLQAHMPRLREFEAAVAGLFGDTVQSSHVAVVRTDNGAHDGACVHFQIRLPMQDAIDLCKSRGAEGETAATRFRAVTAAVLCGKAAGQALFAALSATPTAAADAAAFGSSATVQPAQRPYVNFADRTLTDTMLGDGGADANTAAQRLRARAFFTHLALCHTVVPETVPGQREPKLSASSPDDQALVAGAAYFGFAFTGRAPGAVILRVHGEEREVELLEVLDFNSTRKRMSVIVRVDGKLTIYTKGADSVILERLAVHGAGPEAAAARIMAQTNAHLEAFAAEGLRTLLVAQRELDDEFFADWSSQYRAALVDPTAMKAHASGGYDANMSPNNEIDRLMELVECDLELLGATAIEDKLQEGVPRCVADLRESGTKVWVLTGDKMSTAVNIGFACDLLVNGMNRIELDSQMYPDGKALEQKIVQELTELRATSPGERDSALVVDGTSLKLLLRTTEGRRRLLMLATRCTAFIGCRVSPAQKAAVVELVREYLPRARTLAIGDGANDVSMIQAAHVGVGISGQEGMQAVNNSDFAIAQFRYLGRLLLVHGRWNYHRLSHLCHYMFYKNVLQVLTQWWFIWYSCASGQKIMNELGVQAYNVLFTAFPIVALAVLDKDVDQPRQRGGSLRSFWVQLYQAGPRDEWFTPHKFWRGAGWILLESLLAFFFVAGASWSALPNGGTPSVYEIGAGSLTAVIVLANVAVGFMLYRWQLLHVALIIFGPAVWFLCAMTVFSSADRATSTGDGFWSSNLFVYIVETAWFWLTLLLIVGTAAVARFAEKAYKRLYRPQMHNIVAEAQHVHLGGDTCACRASVEAHLYSNERLDAIMAAHPRGDSNPLRVVPNPHTVLPEAQTGSETDAVLSVAADLAMVQSHTLRQLDAHREAHRHIARVLSDTECTPEQKVSAIEQHASNLDRWHRAARQVVLQRRVYTGGAYDGGAFHAVRSEAHMADGRGRPIPATLPSDCVGTVGSTVV